MKKLLLFAVLCLTSGLQAQSVEKFYGADRALSLPAAPMPAIGKVNGPAPLFKGPGAKTVWVSYLDSFRLYAGITPSQFGRYRFPIFPDSTVKSFYPSGTPGQQPVGSYVNFHQHGSVFHMQSAFFNDDTMIGYNNPFKLDSIAFYYFYRNRLGDTTDELEISVYWGESLNQYFFTNTKEVTASPFFDTIALSGKKPKYVHRMKLSPADTAFLQANIITFPVNQVVPARSPVAFIVKYKPGTSYSFGDTLDYPDGWNKAPRKKMNVFSTLMWEDNTNTRYDTRSYNFDLELTSGELYPRTAGGLRSGWRGLYVPGNAWNNSKRYMYSFFQVTQDTTFTGINAGFNGNVQSSEIVPNPVTGTAKIAFSLKSPAFVHATVSNLLGQRLVNIAGSRFAAGRYNLDLNAAGLTPGIYFYTLTVDGVSVSKRFLIAE